VTPFDLKKTLQEINAAKIFPVHTEHVELFAKFMRGLKSQTIQIEKGKEYKI
jgi:mRNA degradation ribonuclease J1/J2